MHEFDVHAATDVTGFGLLGHLLEMCKASNVSAEVQFKELSFLDDPPLWKKPPLRFGQLRSEALLCIAHYGENPPTILVI